MGGNGIFEREMGEGESVQLGDGDGEGEGEVGETCFPLQGRVGCSPQASSGGAGDKGGA